MVDNNTAGGSGRYRKVSSAGISERLFSWGKVQSEIVSAENEYLQIAGSLAEANKNIDQLKRENAALTTKYEQATTQFTQISEKLAEETIAHQLLKESYEANSQNWSDDDKVKELELHNQQTELAAKKSEISRLETELENAVAKAQELETQLAENKTELAEKTSRYDALTSEYTELVRQKNESLDRLAASEETISNLTQTHEKEIEALNKDFEEKGRQFLPTIHELTRTVDSWKYQRECDLTEIHRLRTDLDDKCAEAEKLRKELNELRDVKMKMLTDINRMGFTSVKADLENQNKQEQLKEEQARLTREISNLQQTKHSLESDLCAKKETLSTYSAITSEILDEWKEHAKRTRTSITDAAGTAPTEEKYGLLATISGHHTAFVPFAPSSYEELRNADAMVREAAKKLATCMNTSNCRKEAFIVVPDECMMYITKTLYASPACSVEVITPSQVIAAVRTIARFVVYEKTQTR
ncbi:hypothetical protein [Methanorbis furvi]|uniref:Uncharacterized protein n=1 Tax=Methanorbis furvi TaxID=3028299 RepID=A0AAE4S9P3_9EURY|nr:hypothetical protein [Methanocorpusculaceae archaeon Ag1]